MSRQVFQTIANISVSDLLLDTGNPRIRHGADQNDCIQRIARDRQNFTNLMADIVSAGLSPEHIIVSPGEDGRWIVRDGNRRVTALKLLNNPSLASFDASLSAFVKRLAESNGGPLATVDCLSCTDEAKIIEFINRKHTGENAGVGQRGWSALLKSLFNINNKLPDPNKRAVQLVIWCEERGLAVDDEFPVTTLTRILSTETLALIGFQVVDDELKPSVDEAASTKLAKRLIEDAASGVIHVKRDGTSGSVYSIAEQKAYLQKIRDQIFPEVSTENKITVPDIAVATNDSASLSVSVGESGNGQSVATISTISKTDSEVMKSARLPTSPTTPSWDRPCIFLRKHPGFSIPASETKAWNIIAEIKKINVRETPIAASMMLRSLVEQSMAHYRAAHSIQKDKSFKRDILAAISHMEQNKKLDDKQVRGVKAIVENNDSVLSAESLHQYVHTKSFHPNAQTLNTIWDQISCFVIACWAS